MQGTRNALIRPRRAAKAEIDTTGEQGVERAELFGDHQRIVIGQHDPARADADGLRGVADMRQHDRCRPARDPFHAVMFGDPIAMIARLFGSARQQRGIGKGAGQSAAFYHGDEVEHREFHRVIAYISRV